MSIRVVLLLAGRGERLRPLTDARPKCLVELGGAPLLMRAIDLLAERGLTRFTVVDGYRGEMIRGALRERYSENWFRFVRNEEWETTNNAYSLLLARFAEPEPMLLLDGDIAFAPEVLDRVLDDPHPNRIALRTRGDLGDEEMKVRLAADGRVTDIAKTIPPAEAAGESMGIEVFSAAFTARLFAAIERRIRDGAGRDEFYEAAFVELIRGGEAVFPVDLDDLACVEIDTPADLEHARGVFGDPS
jgi:choline kinase